MMKRFSVRWTGTMAAAALFLSVLLSVSCQGGSNNIFGCPEETVSAAGRAVLTGTPLSFEGQPVMQIFNLHAAGPYLLVKARVPDNAGQLFVFRLREREYAGSFLPEGRGPGELLKPMCAGTCSSRTEGSPLYVFDLALGGAYAFDVEASVQSGRTELAEICRLPGGTLYAYPFRDSLHFVKIPEAEGMTGMVLDPDGGVLEKTGLYRGLSGWEHFDKLSSADVFFPGTGILAMAMSMFPQVNFIDLGTGERHTAAVDGPCRDPEPLLAGEAPVIVCYMAAVAARGRLIALYHGTPLAEWAAGNSPAHLHVFSAEGEFLYDLSLNESLKAITYSESTGMLYGADAEDRLFAYDLSEVL